MQYNLFDSSGLFQITHGFGELTFTQAKIMDIIWDIIVGRVGQFMMAFLEWRALSTYFHYAMYKSPITYNLFWTIYMDFQPSLLGTWGIFRETILKSRTRSRLTAAFVVLSMLFIMAFPTLASAMTGYRPNTKSFVVDQVGSLVPFEAFSLAAYMVHDVSRIGLKDNQVIPFTNTVEFVRNSTYGFFGLDSHSGDKNDVATTWRGTSVPKPALNISAFFLPLGSNYFWGHDWVDPRTRKRPFSDPSGAAMAVDGTSTAYSLYYVQQNGSCQPQGTYQWGFAFLQVFIVVILLLVWTVGTYMMWLGPHKSLRRLGAKETPRKYGAAMSLVTGVTRELRHTAQNSPQTLTNRQLERIVKTDLDGGNIANENILVPFYGSDYKICASLWAWVKSRASLVVQLTILSLYLWFALPSPSLFLVFGVIFIVPVHTGIAFALAIGKTRKTRVFLAVLGFLIGTIAGSSFMV
ncbi:hypothetical protein V8F06_014449, partial [Rhypophila decipiens]